MGFEPMMRVLQTLALPLGHVAIIMGKKDFIRSIRYTQGKKPAVEPHVCPIYP